MCLTMYVSIVVLLSVCVCVCVCVAERKQIFNVMHTRKHVLCCIRTMYAIIYVQVAVIESEGRCLSS